ncbi:MAG: S1C family serine protease [Bacillota bacterium]
MEQEPRDLIKEPYTGGMTESPGPATGANPYQYNINGASGATTPPKKRKGGFIALVIACSLATGTLGGVAGALVAGQPAQTVQSSTAAENNTASNDSANTSLEDSTKTVAVGDGQTLTVAQITQKVGPSVVAISTKSQGVTTGQGGFNTEQVTGAGSGIIISSDGYIVTNEHVVSGASSITVRTQDSKEYTAKVVGSDSQTDIALLKIEANGLTAATLGDSSAIKVGELAVAIGNPLGELANTVTVGIISALDRDIDIDGQTMRLLQTDAAINPGNSGGALINAYGQVIGINTAKTSAVGVEGLGFAIPINDAKPVIEALKTKGYVSGRTKLGIYTRDIDEQTASMYNMPQGVYVVSVEPFSGAEIAGIKAGDVITGFDGQTVKTTAQINEIKKKHSVGDTVSFTLVRNGQTINGSIKLGEDK